VSKSLEAEHNHIESEVRSFPVKYIDETGYRQNNKRGFAWTLGNELAVKNPRRVFHGQLFKLLTFESYYGDYLLDI
jgi:hypothetical protein